MSWGNLGSSWEYSRWIRNVARNARITNPDPTAEAALLAGIKTYLKAIWNPQTQTGTRSWLENRFNRLSVSGTGSSYQGDIDDEPVHILVKMLEVVGRDLKKIPLSNAEKTLSDTLIGLASNRHLGTGPYFGGVSGDGAVAGDF